MLPDMLLPPFDVEIETLFDSFIQIDNRELTALTLFAGSAGANYSDQLADSFTFSRDGVTIEIQGENFDYSGGVPTSGLVEQFSVLFGNTGAYQWAVIADEDNDFQGLPISVFLNATDPLALAKVLFAQNDLVESNSFQSDVLYGFAGDDQVNGGNGANRLYGGDGNDQVNGGRDDDRLYGDAGDDWLSGSFGNDILNGGEGSDTANFFRKFAPVDLKLKNEKTAKAHIGVNEVDKLKNVENALGGLGADKLTGDRGNNQFDGDAGNDILNGRGGNDILAGGYGYDTLTGGRGDDVFLFDKLLALSGGIINIDTITDFGNGDDSIHLRQVVFSELTAGVLSADNFRAAPNAIGGLDGQQFIVYNTSNGALYYDSSGDGSGMIFQFATVKGAPQLTAADFVVFVPEYDIDI
jgi:Ca2+-binding RTX toxin-like protein